LNYFYYKDTSPFRLTARKNDLFLSIHWFSVGKKATHFTLLLDPVFGGRETKACFLVPVERTDKDTLFAHHTRTHLARNTCGERQVESL